MLQDRWEDPSTGAITMKFYYKSKIKPITHRLPTNHKEKKPRRRNKLPYESYEFQMYQVTPLPTKQPLIGEHIYNPKLDWHTLAKLYKEFKNDL